MPRGKHAPQSSLSFYLSLGRALGGAAAALGLVAAIAVVAAGGGSDETKAGDAARRPPDGKRITPSPTVAPSPTATIEGGDGRTLPPRRVSVIVLNGDGRRGLAARTADRVSKEGYEVLDVSNEAITRTSTVFFGEGFAEEARALQKAFPEFTKIEAGERRQEPDLLLVIGKDFP